MSTSPERSVLLKSQIANLKAQSGQELARLEQMNADGEATRLFKANLRDYWNKLEPLHESMKGVRARAAYTFVQEEIVTRRTALSNSLRRITSAGQASLQDSERQFVEKRQDAVRRLLFLLTLCVVLALLVSGFTLRYAGGLERQTVRRYEEVNQAKREMEQLSARLLEIEEDGRRRLSRELHDGIGQALAILQIEVSHAQLLTQGSEIQLRIRSPKGG